MIVKTWREALDKLSQLEVGDPSIEDLCSAADILDSWDCYPASTDNRLKKHWVHHWTCTDTWVGLAIYTLDGQPVAFSSQSGRKSREEFYFLSRESAESVRTYLVSFKEVKMPVYPLVDLDEVIDPRWFQ